MTALTRPGIVVPRPAIGQVVGLALMSVSAAIAVWKSPDPHRLVIGLGYFGVLALIAGHDARTQKAPNRVVYPALAVATLASLTLGWGDAQEALLGGALSFAVLLALAVAGRGAMGAGDVKVGTLCGMAVGLHGAVPMLLLTFMASGATAALFLLLRVRRRSDTIAFTPFLAAATILCTGYFHLYLWS